MRSHGETMTLRASSTSIHAEPAARSSATSWVEDAASRWLKLRRRKQAGLPELREALGPGRRLTDRRVGRLAFDPAQFAIGDVRVPAGFDHSDRPWTVEADLADPTDVDFHLVGVSVEAAGTSFVVEALAEAGERTVRVESGDGHGLPIGPATFVVAAYRADGSRATSWRSVFVLPGNPLSLSLGPNGSRVIGTWSARGDFIEGSDRSEADIAILEVMAAELDPFAAASAIGAGKKKINWSPLMMTVLARACATSGLLNRSTKFCNPTHSLLRNRRQGE